MLGSALVLAAGCGTEPGGSSGGPSVMPTNTGAPSRGPVVVSLDLARTSAHPGQPIRATVTIENRSARPVMSGCGIKLGVGLTNARFSFDPAFTDECRPTAPLRPGAARVVHTVVQTTYLQCTRRPGDVTANLPRCLRSSPPPLPVGSYRTKVVLDGLSPTAVRLPAAVAVTLR